MYGLNERDLEIMEKLLGGQNITSLCEEYKISRESVIRIRSKHNWRKSLSEKHPETFKLAEFLEFGRAYNALVRRSDILTIPDLVSAFQEEDGYTVMRIGTLGKKSVEFIIDKLQAAGYAVSDELLKYIGRSRKLINNVIDFSEKRKEVANGHIKGYIDTMMTNMIEYVKFKIHLSFDMVMLSDENLEFLESLSDENVLLAIMTSDCLKHFADNVKSYSGDTTYDLDKIDIDLNKYLRDTLSCLKELYESRINEEE